MSEDRPGATPESSRRSSLPLDWHRIALASIGDAVIATDNDGRITFLNPVAESLTGWSHDEAIGVALEGVLKIINQRTRQLVESPSVRALREGVIVGLANHSLLIAKDGAESPIDDSAAPIRNERGDVVGVVLVFRDVTERYRQEQALREALRYADDIVATLREPFLVLDAELRVLTANRSFYQTFGVTSEETIGRFVYELGDRQWDIPRLRTLLEEVLPRRDNLEDFEVAHDFPTLGPKIMLLNARRIRTPGDDSKRIVLAIEDVTERREAELTVQDSELRYRRLFQTAKDGILILDAGSLEITDANPFMTELLGYTHEELVGKELWQIGPFADKEASKAAFRELQEKGYIRYEHLPLQSNTGAQVEVEFVSNVYPAGERLVAQCNIRDISERSRLERKSLQQAEALADLDRRKDEFLAMLGHELRNPLAPIMNAVLVLGQQPNEEPLQRQARMIIERQMGQLTHLVDDLLEVSRITTGRIHLRQERLSLDGVVKSAAETIRPLIAHRGHRLEVSLPPEPIWLFADAARLEQVVVNLLTNAAKYMDDRGEIRLSIRQEGDEAVLCVRDSGVGIAPDLLPRVFDLFRQGERSLDRSQGGLGIGLSLVRRLVELHGGTVEVHSVVGHGSEFVVRLPVTQMPAAPIAPAAPKARAVAQRCRVLVVDDNIDAAESLTLLLRAAGHEVRMAYDGPSAIEATRDFRPAAVLLDIGLPGFDGHEVARRMRRDPDLAHVLLVAMTGYGQESDRERSRAAGFDHHLVKPAEFANVLRILTTAPVV